MAESDKEVSASNALTAATVAWSRRTTLTSTSISAISSSDMMRGSADSQAAKNSNAGISSLNSDLLGF